MPIGEVYLLALHEPYAADEFPQPINATIVHALSLLHPRVVQPDGGRLYRCLTEFPNRTPGCLVPVSTVTFELGGGDLWPQVADWERVVDDVVRVARDRGCDAMPLGLPQVTAGLIGIGPTSTLQVHSTDGSSTVMGPREREQHLAQLLGHVQRFVAEAPFWPGDNLVPPPGYPEVMPYRPYGPLLDPGPIQGRR